MIYNTTKMNEIPRKCRLFCQGDDAEHLDIPRCPLRADCDAKNHQACTVKLAQAINGLNEEIFAMNDRAAGWQRNKTALKPERQAILNYIDAARSEKIAAINRLKQQRIATRYLNIVREEAAGYFLPQDVVEAAKRAYQKHSKS
jgi:hypothetical protein